MANYVVNKIVCTEEILNEYFIDYYPIDEKLEEPYITFNKLLGAKSLNKYNEKYGESIYYGFGVSYEKNIEGLMEIKFLTKWLYPICAIVKAVEMFKGKLIWYACEENKIYLSKFFWNKDRVYENTLYLENTEYDEWVCNNEDYIEKIEYPDDEIWHYKYENRTDWKVWQVDDLIKRYFDQYPAKEYYKDMRSKKLMNIDEIEEVLYNGTKERIEEVLKKYKVSYEYDEQYRSFNITSLLLHEACKGYKSHYVPSCVKYFGKKHIYRAQIDN